MKMMYLFNLKVTSIGSRVKKKKSNIILMVVSMYKDSMNIFNRSLVSFID